MCSGDVLSGRFFMSLQEFDTGIALDNGEIPQQKYMDFAWEGLNNSNLMAWQNVISPEERSRINGVIQTYIDANNNQNCQ